MVADRASRIAVMSWGDAALQSLPVVHYANGVTINEPDDLRVSSSPFRAIAFIPGVVGVTFPVPIRR